MAPSMRIDPRHLLNLLAIAEHGSFNRAAAARGLSQPALSGSIAELERKLGFAVLTRTRRGSELNEYGRILVQGARTVEAQLAQTAEQVNLARLGVAGPLRIGATPSMTLKFVPELMGRVLREGGKVQLSVREGLDDELIPALRSGDLDILLGPALGPALPAGLAEEPLFDDAFAVGVGPRNPLAKRASLSLDELADSPWVLPGLGSAYRRHLEALFMTSGVPWPAHCVVSNNLQLVESLVTLTNRVTIVTELQARMHNFWRIRTVPLRGGGRRTLSVKWRKVGALPPMGERLVEVARELGREIAARK